jgi:hypothetical protein
MKKLAALFIALGMLLLAVAPAQAAHHSTRHRQRHAHLTHVRKAPSAYAVAHTAPVAAAKFCTYMGGPKSTLWRCY